MEHDEVKCSTPWHNPKVAFADATVILHDCGIRMAKIRRETMPPHAFRLLQLHRYLNMTGAGDRLLLPLDQCCAICDGNLIISKGTIHTCSLCLLGYHVKCL